MLTHTFMVLQYPRFNSLLGETDVDHAVLTPTTY